MQHDTSMRPQRKKIAIGWNSTYQKFTHGLKTLALKSTHTPCHTELVGGIAGRTTLFPEYPVDIHR